MYNLNAIRRLTLNKAISFYPNGFHPSREKLFTENILILITINNQHLNRRKIQEQ
jgi:hypothetical protein